MRNAVVSSDAAAQAAGQAVIADGGNATDAVVAGMLAGATIGSSCALLGSGVVLVAGTGAGAHLVDGRARAPGRGARRGSAPEEPPRGWQAGVPGLLEGALSAHNRFGAAPLAMLVRSATSAVVEHARDDAAKHRLALLEALPRTGLSAIERLGIRHAILNTVGPAAGGLITRDDLQITPSPIHPLREVAAGEYEVLLAPELPPPRYAPPAPPVNPIAAVLCADMRGVVAIALWALPDMAVALPEESGLGLAAMLASPRKGTTRFRPGSLIPMRMPAALVTTQGRAFGGVAASGQGGLEGAMVRALRERLGEIDLAAPADANESGVHSVAWVIRDASGDARATISAAG